MIYNAQTRKCEYRGEEIFPLTAKDKCGMPKHVIYEYYRDELDYIDRMKRLEKWEQEHSEEIARQPTVDECLEDFFEELDKQWGQFYEKENLL